MPGTVLGAAGTAGVGGSSICHHDLVYGEKAEQGSRMSNSGHFRQVVRKGLSEKQHMSGILEETQGRGRAVT